VSSPPEDPEDAAPDSTTDDASAMARLFIRGSWPETARIADILRKETFGGALLLIAAAAALVWANSPWSATTSPYAKQKSAGALHLHLSLGTWAADGLLAIFFFVAGLERKREFVAGDLRDPRRSRSPRRSAASRYRPGCTSPSTSAAAAIRAAGRSRPRRTSRSRSPSSQSSAHGCRWRCGRSC